MCVKWIYALQQDTYAPLLYMYVYVYVYVYEAGVQSPFSLTWPSCAVISGTRGSEPKSQRGPSYPG